MTWTTVYNEWKNFSNLDEPLKKDLKDSEMDQDKLKDAFYAPLEFGTAGMRGILGAGINRMNIYTVRQATEGLALLLEQKGAEAKKRGVAIAFDSRHQSPEFAMEAARVLAVHGINSYVFESLRPTPELSFAVRENQCAAGIMITASHNPAAYNGYKVYGEDGGQMPPDDADAVTNYIRQVENPLTVEVVSDEKHPLIHKIGEAMDAKYLEKMKTVTIDHQLVQEHGKELKLVFTPLHGTGTMIGERALKQAGFEKYSIVPEQAVADPDFSTVKSPNPEEYSAFEYAIELGTKEGADVLVATDPDADRLGASVRLPDGTYQVLTGNQLGALMIEYILSAQKEAKTLPKNAAVLKSIVSSELSTAICEAYGVVMIDVLTGFKFIAEKIKEFEETDEHTFMFGFEESYGYLVKPFVRDKDAIQALILLAEVAAFYKKQGQTLYDGLQGIFEKYGYFKEETISIKMDGLEGNEKIKALMENVRKNAPLSFGGIPVMYTEDFQTQEKITVSGEKESIPLPKSNVLKYQLEEGSWVAIRPSGTEPKIKFYIGAKGSSDEEVTNKVAEIKKTIQQLAK